MVRTRADAAKKAGGKAPRKTAVLSGSTSTSSGSSKGNKHGSGNPYCPRSTPEWQKPITKFFHSDDTDLSLHSTVKELNSLKKSCVSEAKNINLSDPEPTNFDQESGTSSSWMDKNKLSKDSTGDKNQAAGKFENDEVKQECKNKSKFSEEISEFKLLSNKTCEYEESVDAENCAPEKSEIIEDKEVNKCKPAEETTEIKSAEVDKICRSEIIEDKEVNKCKPAEETTEIKSAEVAKKHKANEDINKSKCTKEVEELESFSKKTCGSEKIIEAKASKKEEFFTRNDSNQDLQLGKSDVKDLVSEIKKDN